MDRGDLPKKALYILAFLILGALLFSFVLNYYSKASNESINLNIVDNTSSFISALTFAYGAIGKAVGFLSLLFYYLFWAKWGYKLYRYFNKN